jgi:hypothetical protein
MTLIEQISADKKNRTQMTQIEQMNADFFISVDQYN